MSGTNNSTAPGYLQQVTTNVKGTDSLTDLLQGAVVGITGLDPTLVRPRWQPQPPTQPSVSTTWCALGIHAYDLFDYPSIIHNDPSVTDQPLGSDTLYRLVKIIVLTTFYGPDASDMASALRDGLYIYQNYSTLALSGVKFRGAEDIIYIPELINSQWVPRVDLYLTFMHMNSRTYQVEDLLGGQVSITADDNDSVLVNIS